MTRVESQEEEAKAVAGGETGSGGLEWIVGDWEGERIEAATGDRSPLRSEIVRVLGGAGTEEQLVVRTRDKVYYGLSLQVFDPTLQRSVLMYVNASRRDFARLEGTVSADRAEWHSTTLQGPRRSKLVYERGDDNAWRRTQFVSEDDGCTWNVLFVDELQRRVDPMR